MEIIGYLVYLVNHEVTTQDILFQNRVLFTTWDDATTAAEELAKTFSNRICLIRSTSKTNCHANGYTTAYRLDSADILIFTVQGCK